MGSADEEAIKRLYASYTDAVNRRDPAGMAAVYAEDVEFVITQHEHLGMGKPILGREKMLKGATRLMQDRDHVFQILHSTLVELDGDRAKSRCWFSEVKKPVGRNWEYGFLVFQDEAVKLPEGWRIARRNVASLLRRELSATEFETWPFVDMLGLAGMVPAR